MDIRSYWAFDYLRLPAKEQFCNIFNSTHSNIYGFKGMTLLSHTKYSQFHTRFCFGWEENWAKMGLCFPGALQVAMQRNRLNTIPCLHFHTPIQFLCSCTLLQTRLSEILGPECWVGGKCIRVIKHVWVPCLKHGNQKCRRQLARPCL